MSFKIEADFQHEGDRCIVVARSAGFRCGYVGVNGKNLLFKVNYDAIIKKSKALCNIVDIHGGLTYSGKLEQYAIESDLWFFGFDCAHWNDGYDFEIMDEETKSLKRLTLPSNCLVRTTEYCIDECKKLSEQLNETT